MHAILKAIRRDPFWTQILHRVGLGLMALSLCLIMPACDSGGTNGGDDGGGPDLTAPAAPSGLTAEPGDGETALDWDAVSDADRYNVYRSTSAGVDASGSPLESGITGTSFTDTEVENGTTFFYVVTAVAASGGEEAESDPSGEAEATPFAPPTGLEGTSGDSQVELSWSAAAGAATYNVYRDTSPTDGATGDPLSMGVSETAFTDTSAQNGTEYYYRVTSVNPEDAESSASNEVQKTPFSDPPDRP